MDENVEDIRAKAEVSVGLVRQLVSSWLPKPSPSEREKQPSVKTSVTALYSGDPAASKRQAQLKRKLVGNVGSNGAVSLDPNGRGEADSRLEGSEKRKPVEQKVGDDEEELLHRLATSSKAIKKPRDVLSSYLDREKIGKKKKKKKSASTQ
ncbi:uncharacterized protein SPPG_02002 [Spizellomyces punctatus DAOM BR117]|uniref:Uncharacterized protein n=1 Tax=Spizellomyces punctatus (strain DAOM BR117) TaxID=645134 RepID=A0A0L0HNB9_SPIPD|nr:uncharacterized protein SPPG_02002 [Spizellomyces punctatus DAOM BR117]KND02921.1 hypothetical protein SPPG_02002 [Spizellomyces punctatus DAOM BR117]|eukprot:XP_016610960.1 hypothetical protein SPPG_02002 [Spizellomyces punctatus DAOM BR117]